MFQRCSTTKTYVYQLVMIIICHGNMRTCMSSEVVEQQKLKCMKSYNNKLSRKIYVANICIKKPCAQVCNFNVSL